jgi:hypothetical protein
MTVAALASHHGTPNAQNMSQRDWHDDEEDWSETGGDYEDEFVDVDSNDVDAVPCPECGAEIYSDLDHCPQCGHWLTDADHAACGTGLFASHRVRLIAAILLAIFVLGLLAGTLAL